MAYGQAAMLLSLGAKGYRALQPNASSMLLIVFSLCACFIPRETYCVYLCIAAKLYLPKVNKSSGAVIDMWIKVICFPLSASIHLPIYVYWLIINCHFFQAKELDANTDYYIELLAKGIGKPKEEIAKDIQRPKYFQAQEAIAYGIADKIIDSRDAAYEKRVSFFM